MDEPIYVILKLLFDFALEVWFSIETQTLVLYSSIAYMFVKPNLKRIETNSEQSLN